MAPNDFLGKCTPSVPRCWLLFAAGTVWCGVGTGLTIVSCIWFYSMERPANAVAAAGAFAAGLAVYQFGFSRIASRNIGRIAAQPARICLFAFQAWRSYLLVACMMLLGYALRHLPVPKMLVAAIYLVIGTALLFSSTLYFERFFRKW